MKVKNPAKLRSRRKSRYLTQRQLAGLVRVTQQYISALECGADHDCSEDTAIAICKYLDVEVEDYFETKQVVRSPMVTTRTRGTRSAA